MIAEKLNKMLENKSLTPEQRKEIEKKLKSIQNNKILLK